MTDTRSSASPRWLTAGVFLITLSAFFADLGYQAVLAGFPLFLVLTLGAPVSVFGLATALSYGPGSLIAYLGGRLADRTGRKKIAILGNSLIPLLSFAGVAPAAPLAVGFFATGWWARNFRTPARRALLVEQVPKGQEGQAFGFLHALDIGGGLLAALGTLALVAHKVPFRTIFLLTLIPLAISTLCLVPVAEKPAVAPEADPPAEGPAQPQAEPHRSSSLRVYRALLAATALYGFSSYSLGFPILTVAQGTRNSALGILSYVLFLGVSAFTGLLAGSRKWGGPRVLSVLGYLMAAAGSIGLAWAARTGAGALGYYAAVAVLGFALGVIETLEPTLIAHLTPATSTAGGMGSLTAARSIGLFVGNVLMGLLYRFGAAYSYGYAALVAVAAAVILLAASGPRQPAPAGATGSPAKVR